MLTTEVKIITPEIAGELLRTNILNRPVNKRTVDDYAAQMKKGLWKLNGEPIIISTTGNVIDGQHRLHACIQSDTSFTTVVEYGVDASVFDTIDTGRVRTAGDLFSIVGIGNANKISSIVAAYFNLKKSTNFMSIDSTTLRSLRVSKQEILEFYKQNSQLVDAISEMATKCYYKLRLLPIATTGACALYLVKDKNHSIEKVTEFFYEVFGILPYSNNTVGILHDALNRHIARQNILPPTVKMAYVIKTWNAYITGKEMKALNYNKNRDIGLSFI